MASSGSSFAVRWRAFRIWQKLGFLPWRKEKNARDGKSSRDFYRGAFDSIPFLNDDAKRTFQQLLLRPGHMIRDYISGQHERYLAPFTALIIFYAFFALVSSVLQPIQEKPDFSIPDTSQFSITQDNEEAREVSAKLLSETLRIVRRGYIYLHLDQYPNDVKTKRQASIAALESTLRSQGIPLFLGNFIILWLAMAISLRRFKLGMSACAATAAYVLCQFSFFMLFAVLLTWGKKTSIGVLLMLVLLTIDYHQLLDIKWSKSLRRAISTGVWYGMTYAILLFAVSIVAVLFAYFRV